LLQSRGCQIDVALRRPLRLLLEGMKDMDRIR